MIVETIVAVVASASIGAIFNYLNERFVTNSIANRVIGTAINVATYGGLAVAGTVFGITACLYAIGVNVAFSYLLAAFSVGRLLVSKTTTRARLVNLALLPVSPVISVFYPLFGYKLVMFNYNEHMKVVAETAIADMDDNLAAA